MIKFDELKEVSIANFKGGNGNTKANMYVDDNAKIMKVLLEKDCSIGEHIHMSSSEIIYVINGTAHCIINGLEEVVKANECHYCPKGSTHSIINKGVKPLIMFAVVPNQ